MSSESKYLAVVLVVSVLIIGLVDGVCSALGL